RTFRVPFASTVSPLSISLNPILKVWPALMTVMTCSSDLSSGSSPGRNDAAVSQAVAGLVVDRLVGVENFSQRMGEAADRHCRPARSTGRPGKAAHQKARDVRLHDFAAPLRKRICARAKDSPLHQFEEARFVVEV